MAVYHGTAAAKLSLRRPEFCQSLYCHSHNRAYIAPVSPRIWRGAEIKAVMMNDEQEPKSNPMLRNMAIWSAIIVALLVVASIFNGSSTPANGITYSSFRDKVEAGEVKSVAVAPDRISGKMQNDETFVTVPLPNDSSLPSLLIEKGVVVEAKAEEQPSLLLILVYQALPFLLIGKAADRKAW